MYSFVDRKKLYSCFQVSHQTVCDFQCVLIDMHSCLQHIPFINIMLITATYFLRNRLFRLILINYGFLESSTVRLWFW